MAGELLAVTSTTPPAWPGKLWSYAGRNVDSDVLAAADGASLCEWNSATFLTIGWPLGTHATSTSQSRQYLRDPARVVHSTLLRGSWLKNPSIPQDAKDTGYTYGALKLVLAASDEDVSPMSSVHATANGGREVIPNRPALRVLMGRLRQHKVVNAFLPAARACDFERLSPSAACRAVRVLINERR